MSRMRTPSSADGTEVHDHPQHLGPLVYRVAVATSACLLVVSSTVRADAPSLENVMKRASEYVQAYQKQFSATVAEEQYVQRVVDRRGMTRQTRRLLSDIVMIWLPETESWTGFRAVYEVDGRTVRDHMERLQRLFLESPSTAVSRAKSFANESARYNIGKVGRNINLPMMALDVLKSANVARFTFAKSGEETVEGSGVWVVKFVEQARPTLVRTSTGDIFSQGKFWIDPQQGRFVRSQIIIGSPTGDLRMEITVSYRNDGTTGMWLPAEMDEIYSRPDQPLSDRITCTAIYSNFRRPEVQTKVEVLNPSK